MTVVESASTVVTVVHPLFQLSTHTQRRAPPGRAHDSRSRSRSEYSSAPTRKAPISSSTLVTLPPAAVSTDRVGSGESGVMASRTTAAAAASRARRCRRPISPSTATIT